MNPQMCFQQHFPTWSSQSKKRKPQPCCCWAKPGWNPWQAVAVIHLQCLKLLMTPTIQTCPEMCAKGTKSQLWKQAWYQLDTISCLFKNKRWQILPDRGEEYHQHKLFFPCGKQRALKSPYAKHTKQYRVCIPNFPLDKKKRQKQDYLDVNMIIAVILMNFNNQLSFHIRTRCLYIKFRCNSNYTYFPLFSLYDEGQRIYTLASYIAELYILPEASTI